MSEAPRGEGSPAYRTWRGIREALEAAGCRRGRFHSRGGFRTAVNPRDAEPGYVLSRYPEHRGNQLVHCAAVDHAGPGQQEALARYEAALVAAGFAPRRQIKKARGRKEVLLIEIMEVP